MGSEMCIRDRRGAMTGAVVAVPLILLSVARLTSEVTGSGADGALIRCGTPLAHATNEISSMMCGQMADQARVESLGAVGVALVVLLGGAYVGAAWGRDRSRQNGADEPGPGETTDEGKEPR